MFKTITIQDELPFGKVLNELQFEVGEETLTVRDLIRRRIHEEVTLHNLALEDQARTMVQPTAIERLLNGERPVQPPRLVDWQKQADLAEQAFEANRFFILVGDRQVDSLDEIIRVGEATRISFLRLTPLVGG